MADREHHAQFLSRFTGALPPGLLRRLQIPSKTSITRTFLLGFPLASMVSPIVFPLISDESLQPSPAYLYTWATLTLSWLLLMLNLLFTNRPLVPHDSDKDAVRNNQRNASKFSAIGELSAGIAHEINNPLTIVAGNIARLKRKIQARPANDETELDLRLLDVMAEATGRISVIVDGLRTYARADSSEQTVFDLIITTRKTLTLVSSTFAQEGIYIDLEMPMSEVWVKGVEGRLQQVIMNLLANAKDATEGQTSRKISVCITSDSGMTTLVVRDNGKGISSKAQSKLFNHFYTTKPVGRGTGMGLAISKNIVDEHQGHISFSSKPGNTEFQIQLPARHRDRFPRPLFVKSPHLRRGFGKTIQHRRSP